MDFFPRTPCQRLLVVVSTIAVFVIVATVIVRSQTNYHRLRIGDHVIDVRLADSTAEQSQGLSDVADYAPLRDKTMYFVFKDHAVRNFWMYHMNFPLDVVWIDGGVIVGASLDVPSPESFSDDPARMNSVVPADAVLELPAGTFSSLGLSIGDTALLEAR